MKTENIDKELLNMEEELEQRDDYNESPPADIIAFNEQRSCSDLLRMYKENQIKIDPDFQRDVVWNNAAQTRFIDSLVKQLPIPSMCISLDYQTDARLMIDGLQRISSIIRFLNEDDWKLSDLEDINDELRGRTAGFIKNKHKTMYSRVQNLMIPITVLRCDYQKKSHMEYLFTIFHRLNTGANKLNNQEIRNCIYSGRFNDELKRIANSDLTINLFNLDKEKVYRQSYAELYLRILSHSDRYEKYSGKLSKYLNDFMDEKRDISENAVRNTFCKLETSLSLVYNNLFEGKSLPRLSKATTEALFIGVMRNIDYLKDCSSEELKSKYKALILDPLFSVDALKEGLANKEKVIKRLSKAQEIFSNS